MRHAVKMLAALVLGGCPKDSAPLDVVPVDPVEGNGPTEPEDEGSGMGPNYRAYEVTAAARAIVEAKDRDPKDVADDPRRRPRELLSFAEVAPGQRVADLGAGGGYTTELLVRAVGDDGVVFAHNDEFARTNYARDTWPARLAKPINAKVVRADQEFEDPLPAEATDLDLVTIVFSYHDAVVRGQDVVAMNKRVFAHLRPGGLYVILDHSARPGSGTQDTETLHRIDEKLVIQQVEAAGFELVETADFLRDPADTRDWPVWKRGFVTDRFALKFQKPTE
jgi:predicted methyltransferase